MVMVKMREDVGAPPDALTEAMGREIGLAMQSGVMTDAGALLPTTRGVELRLSDGVLSATDGPFAEAREVVGGYSILRAESDEEAVRLAHRVAEIHQEFWPGWEGAVEVRAVSS
jgi:hypothetical protein